MCGSSFIFLKKKRVGNQDQPCGKYKKPDDQRLKKVFFKGAEEGFYGSAVVVFDCAEHAVIKCGKGWANGDKRDTAQDKKQVGNDNISDFIKKNMYNVVFVE